MSDQTASEGQPPPYPINSPQPSSGPPTTEPTGLSAWQRRWNREWLNEAYVPYMRHNDLLMERWANRDRNYRLCSQTRPDTEQFILNAIEAGIASPKSTLTQTRWPRGTHHCTWPVRMLASKITRLWGRWRKFREDGKTWQMVAVMEEHGETPRWRGEMRLTFRDGFLYEYLNSRTTVPWIDFPSGQNIKWYLVRAPCGREWLQGGQDARSWAPNLAPESCIPFVVVDGNVVRHCRPHNAHELADGNVFDNFTRSCQHCGQRS
ncbi:hypothetical protein F5Y12DRAFT_716012 [Xylaria sp. FL1777]|nr:hypothetical protein F5Y12DRAFT_716012 [Xylaria sp. FL1777]